MQALSFDVEDYFQVSAFEKQINPADWDSFECRIERNVNLIIDTLSAQENTQATFFILGWIAERYPQLVHTIASAGHEIASHGYNHQRIINMSSSEFKQDVTDSKKLLEDLSGQTITGYRAPSFSLAHTTPWAIDELRNAGYQYSSSVNPVPHDLYGMPDAPRTPFLWENGLLELPVTTLELFNKRFPCSGGGFFRLYPYTLFKKGLLKASSQLDGPIIFYLHPWELDPQQPRIQGASIKSRFRHYLNLEKTLPRLNQLLEDFQWCAIRDLDVMSAKPQQTYTIKAA